MTTQTLIERVERGIIPFDDAYRRAMDTFNQAHHQLLLRLDDQELRFDPANKSHAARLGFYKLLLDHLAQMPDSSRALLDFGPNGTHPGHYLVRRAPTARGVALELNLRRGNPGTYRAKTFFEGNSGQAPICDIPLDACRQEYARTIRAALNASYERLLLPDPK